MEKPKVNEVWRTEGDQLILIVNNLINKSPELAVLWWCESEKNWNVSDSRVVHIRGKKTELTPNEFFKAIIR